MLNSLLGAYDDSDGEDAAAPAARPAAATAVKAAPQAPPKPLAPASQAEAKAKAASKPSVPIAVIEVDSVLHGTSCDCEDCTNLLARFSAKSLVTKGIRFKCKLCNELTPTKAGSGEHFQVYHWSELQAFKRQKEPKLFTEVSSAAKAAAAAAAARRMSFAVEDVLCRKRPAGDSIAAFGGWAKKEKPEPPPCEQPGYQEQINETVITPGVPWLGPKPTNEDATEMDKEVDKKVHEMMELRFVTRNVMRVNPVRIRCKLCFKMYTEQSTCYYHISDEHQEDFKKEQKNWERFLFTTCRRQPPFGWVCKVCQLFFPSDGACWRHLGKEVFIMREERHIAIWKEKEDRWGHEEDEECCGDGINVGKGLSYESVQLFNKQEEDEKQRDEEWKQREKLRKMNAKEESSSSEEVDEKDVGKIKPIKEF